MLNSIETTLNLSYFFFGVKTLIFCHAYATLLWAKIRKMTIFIDLKT